ncbi:MAG TPA: nitrate reductase molybdenum cofactor assembly chaperone [Segeticoccus sp.]|uniref:nitrate reductase molybdenum cofactor assembly chaperone n=1 Tax=Segeticoccus sp. TaxID=2706531 RepID=UPI002D7FE724|nr:nitrate reductase molybdenum cofactor assembly chaperone [Segeticoccus sp.]HET8600160.1 nitrate reductase molybdenum cofactor assembly chaperone [Segeticoccus sp.]
MSADNRTRTLYQVASLLLQYPDEELLDRLPLLRSGADAQPSAVGAALEPLLQQLETRPLVDLQADYVQIFDLKRKCCPYLTYYAHGDTRNRGMALLNFKSAYRRAGVVLDEGELPDHLAVVLEFTATVDLDEGRRLLLENRAGLELLRLALRASGSAYEGVLAAVSSTLPTLRGDEEQAVRTLVAQGPPQEDVGLEPFAPPEFMKVGSRP